MVRLSCIKGLRSGVRTKVAVLYGEEVTAGYRFADWFALHGYQATLTSMAQEFERDLVELHPDVIVIGLQSMSPFQQAVPRVRSSCPQVPIIAIMDNSLDRRGEGSGPAFMKTFCSDLFMCRTFDPPSKSS